MTPVVSSNLLQSEISRGICAELRTVATSNNRDHPTRSLLSSPLASTINCSPGSQASLEVTYKDYSTGITLLLHVRATYIYFCSSRTSRSWWITQSTQHHRRGCNKPLQPNSSIYGAPPFTGNLCFVFGYAYFMC